MRRRTRLGLATIAALLVAAGAYTAFWFVVAGRLESGFAAWAQSAQADKIDLSWRKLRVTGYPAAFRINLDAAVLRDTSIMPSPEFRTPILSGSAHPWDFADWRLAMPDGFTADIVATHQRTPVRLAVHNADGLVSIAPEGGWKLSLTLRDTTVLAGVNLAAGLAHATITVPPSSPAGRAAPGTVLEVDASQIKLPIAIGPMGDSISELSFAATVKGAVPGGNLAEAAAAWRDAGGAIELDNLRLDWGALGATAAGTLSLDRDLQPIGELSGAIRGYDQILTTLVQSGQIRTTDARLARIALTILAKTGPDGKPQIQTTFAIQDGQMFLGPARLGRVPRLTWE